MSRPQTPGRLSLTHPDYKYPRSKNPYWTKLLEVTDYAASDNAPESFQGKARDQFRLFSSPEKSTAPLCVELGCNAGHWLIPQAEKHPHELFIGLDWKHKVIHRAAVKARDLGLKNSFFYRVNGERLRYLFGPGEVNRWCIFFPDPWEKKNQLKNRLIQETFLRSLVDQSAPNALLHIKTDHAGYFDWILDAISKCTDRWQVESQTRDLWAGVPSPEKLPLGQITVFERVFLREKLPIHEVKLRKK